VSPLHGDDADVGAERSVAVSREGSTARAAPQAHAERKAARRRRCGSYAWPSLRKEYEDRLAAGEARKEIVADIRRRYADCPANLPSDRTFRRWASEFFDKPRRDPAPRKPARKAPRPRPVLPVPVVSRPPLVQSPMPRTPTVAGVCQPVAQAPTETAETARPPPR
jgi:hypothetical protein